MLKRLAIGFLLLLIVLVPLVGCGKSATNVSQGDAAQIKQNKEIPLYPNVPGVTTNPIPQSNTTIPPGVTTTPVPQPTKTATIADLQKQVDTLSARIKTLEDEVSGSYGSGPFTFSSLEDRVKSLEDEVSGRGSLIGGLDSRVDALESKVGSSLTLYCSQYLNGASLENRVGALERKLGVFWVCPSW